MGSFAHGTLFTAACACRPLSESASAWVGAISTSPGVGRPGGFANGAAALLQAVTHQCLSSVFHDGATTSRVITRDFSRPFRCSRLAHSKALPPLAVPEATDNGTWGYTPIVPACSALASSCLQCSGDQQCTSHPSQ